MKTYTKADMLALWKRTKMLEPLRTDCSAQCSYGVDLDAICEQQMRQWYLDLLVNGPIELVPVSRITPRPISAHPATLSGTLTLPTNTLRVTWVKVEGWRRGVAPIKLADAPKRLMAALSHPFTRPGIENPVAILMPDHTLELFPITTRRNGMFDVVPTVETLMGVDDPGPDEYRFDESAIALIGNSHNL